MNKAFFRYTKSFFQIYSVEYLIPDFNLNGNAFIHLIKVLITGFCSNFELFPLLFKRFGFR